MTERFLSVALMAISLVAVSMANAESAAEGSLIEEIIVTGEKRGKDLQTSAVVGAVLDEQALRDNAISELDDLEFATPSLTIATAGQSNQMNLRGLGKFDSGGTSTSAVATYRDGVGTVSSFATLEPYYDISSVEVLRGPQGTFVGENAAGGAIFVNTRNPELGGGTEGYVEAGFGDYSKMEVTGAVTLPVADTLALRLAGRRMSRDSFYDVYIDEDGTVPHPRDPGERDHLSLRASALWAPIDNLEVLAKVDYNDLDHGGHVFGTVPGFPYPVGSITGEPWGNISDDLYTVGNNYLDVHARDKLVRGILDLSYSLDGGGEGPLGQWQSVHQFLCPQ